MNITFILQPGYTACLFSVLPEYRQVFLDRASFYMS
jgi:hypothetical protein